MTLKKWAARLGAATAVGVISIASATPALAASGSVLSLNQNAKSIFNDQNDAVSACDRTANNEYAVAFIDVRQADGSWLRRPSVVDTVADGTCNTEIRNVSREGAALRLWSCEITINGTLNACRYIQLDG
ncbi:hypothetical protein [Nocardioides plantarum]|uniref:Ricin B lectin domain-containing protein n=1 Tax=Nocardioides plantarum TaxID=29299 RepID=A0ABV5K6S2_9ACTN|nr:hypothetical protein [Nocardioides plantarum]